MVPSCSRLWSTSSSICKETNHVKGKKKSGTDKISYSQGSKKSKARVTCYISLPHLHILHVENCRHTYIMKKSSWSSQSCCLMRQQGKKKKNKAHFLLIPRQCDLRNSAQGAETDAKLWAAWSDQAKKKKTLRHCKVIINLFYASGHPAFSKVGLEMFRLVPHDFFVCSLSFPFSALIPWKHSIVDVAKEYLLRKCFVEEIITSHVILRCKKAWLFNKTKS